MATIDFKTFTREHIAVGGDTIFVRRAGSGPAVLLMHGYPETQLAWRKVAPALAERCTVVAVDLPGYGDSRLSDRTGQLSKRTMARVLADLMIELGVTTFAVAGHDRGARVAYRLALDFPERVSGLAVLDIIPILEMANRLTYAAARQMAHWFWLAQPSRIPEILIGLDPESYLRHIIEAWGGSGVIEDEALDDYLRCMRDPDVRRAISAEYQADQLDVAHDQADLTAHHRIACPVLVLWAQGGLAEAFGDPLAIWREWADRVTGHAIPGGHFMMEESPQQVISALLTLLADTFRTHDGAR